MCYVDHIRRLIAETEAELAAMTLPPVRLLLTRRLHELAAILAREEAAGPPPSAALPMRAG